jgi:hypothetical protein
MEPEITVDSFAGIWDYLTDSDRSYIRDVLERGGPGLISPIIAMAKDRMVMARISSVYPMDPPLEGVPAMEDETTMKQEVAKFREALEWIRDQTSETNDGCVCLEVHDRACEVLGDLKFVYLVEYHSDIVSASSSFEGARVRAENERGDRMMVRDYDPGQDLHPLWCCGEKTNYWIRRVRLED